MFPATARITFRKFQHTEVDQRLVYTLNSHPQVMRHIGPLKNRQQALDDLQRYLRYYEQYPGYGYGAAFVQEEFIGWYVLKKLPETDEPEVGYRLLPKFWQQGLATEGAQAVLDYGFDQLGCSHIVAVAAPANTGSRKVLEKIGMHYQHLGTYYGTECAYYQLGK